MARRRARSILPAGALCAVVAGATLLTAACGSGSSGASTNSSAGSSSSTTLLGPAKAATGTPVNVGWESTGQTQAIDTTDEEKAAQATAAYANAHLGGLAGHPINLVVCDDKGVPAQAQACGNEFVTKKVSVVSGGSPGETDPWIKIVNAAGIPSTLNFASTQYVLATPNVFIFANPLGSFGTPAVYARENGIKSAAALVIDVPAASGPAKQLLPAFFGNAAATVNVVTIPPGTADMTPQVQAAQGKKPGMYYVLGDPTFCSSAIKAIKTLGISAPVMAIDRCIGNDKGASIPGGYQGISIAAQADTDPNDKEFQLYSQVIKTYGKGLSLAGNTFSGYQGLLGLVRAVNASGGTDTSSAGISAALKKMPPTPYPLGGGATFQCSGNVIPAISKNICGSASFTATAATDGTLSDFKSLDAGDIYKLG